MDIILTLFILFVGGGWLIARAISRLFIDFKEDPPSYQMKETPTIINNYKTENHLHISKKDLETFIDI